MAPGSSVAPTAPSTNHTRTFTLTLVSILALAVGCVVLLPGSSSSTETATDAVTPLSQRPCEPPYGTFREGNWPSACWRPYSDASPFNRRVPPSPRLLSNSGAIVDRLVSWGPPQKLLVGNSQSGNDYGHPVYWSQPSDPVFEIDCVRFSGCEVDGMRVRIPDAAQPADGGDAHLAVIDQKSGYEYDFWQVRSKPKGGGRLVVSHGGRTQIQGSGLGSNATAAWFGLAAGIVRAPELLAGRIDHALFASAKCTSGESVHPASPGTTGTSCATLGLTSGNAPPLGARLWLDMSPTEIRQLRVSLWEQAILTALAEYGAFIGDTNRGNAAWGLVPESSATYTSFGYQDPWDVVGLEAGGHRYRGGYVLDFSDSVGWSEHLRVLNPCVSARTC